MIHHTLDDIVSLMASWVEYDDHHRRSKIFRVHCRFISGSGAHWRSISTHGDCLSFSQDRP